MRIRGKLTVRNDAMIKARKAEGLNQRDAADKCGVSHWIFMCIERLDYTSLSAEDAVVSIATGLGIQTDEVMPTELAGRNCGMDKQSVSEIPTLRLLESCANTIISKELPPPDVLEELEVVDEMKKLVRLCMDSAGLTYREKQVLKLRFGFGDIWEPLIAIADAAQNGWETWARHAAVALHSAADETDGSVGIELLGDIRGVFGDDTRLSTRDLLDRLYLLEESPWSDWNGKPIIARWLADHLRGFGVRSKTMKFDGKSAKGYEQAAFTEPWDRYLPPAGAVTGVDAVTPQVAQGNPAESETVTVGNHKVTAPLVTDRLPIVTEAENAEKASAATEVTPVTAVTAQEGESNVYAVFLSIL